MTLHNKQGTNVIYYLTALPKIEFISTFLDTGLLPFRDLPAKLKLLLKSCLFQIQRDHEGWIKQTRVPS